MISPAEAPDAPGWLELQLPSGRPVLVRTVDEGHEEQPGDDLLQDVRLRDPDLRSLASALEEVAGVVRDAVAPLAPDEATVEVGIGISAQTGQLLALFGQASAEAAVKVTLTWKFEKAERRVDRA